jgi:hypothetical protein
MTPRPRDEVWDALDLHFGPVRTRAERGRRNVAVKQLKEAGASPEEIRIAFDWCQKSFTIFTEMALVSHLGRALHEDVKAAAPTPISLVRRMADGGS